MERERFTTIYALYFKMVRKVAGNITKDWDAADDIAQNIFVKMLIDDYSNVREMEFYLYTAAKRQALRYLKYKDRNTLINNEAQRRMWEKHEQVSYSDELRKAISCLPKQQKRVIVLNRLSGWSCDKIGNALHITRYTAFNHLKAAQRTLKQKIHR